MPNRWLVLGTAALVLAVAAGGVVWWRSAQTTTLEGAAALAPAGTQRMTWTDWAGVRTRVGATVDGSSSAEEVAGFLDEAYEADLSSMSALVESTPTMQEEYGFSPASLEWELLAQSPDGSVAIMQLSEDTDFDALADRLEALGYQRPDDDTGVWRGGRDLLPAIGSLTPQLQHLALDADHQRVLASDTARYAEVAIGAATGDRASYDGLGAVLGAAGEPLAAAVYDDEVVCNALAMGRADDAAQDQADDLLAAAGEVSPVTGFVMGSYRNGEARVLMSFADDEQARTNADTRARLASGPAPGQGGDFADRFRLGRVSAEGDVVTMRLDPVAGSYLLSDLTTGPVLYATC